MSIFRAYLEGFEQFTNHRRETGSVVQEVCRPSWRT